MMSKWGFLLTASWMPLLCVVFGLSACNQASEVRNGGSVVGNGRQYQNSKMGIVVEYPENWDVREANDRLTVVFDNERAVQRRELSSSIQFSLEPDLDGQKFSSVDKLGEYLRSRWPQGTWQAIQFVGGQNGFFWRQVVSGREKADYYLFDQNQNVLSVNYDATLDLGGTGVVRKIVAALSIDFEAPIIESVHFEPAIAAPGETVKLVVNSWDLIGDVTEISADLHFLGNPEADFSWLGWPWRVYHLTPLRWEGGSRYVTEFSVPKYEPAGKIGLGSMKAKDSKGNAIDVLLAWERVGGRYQHAEQYRIRPLGSGTYLSSRQTQLPIEAFTVENRGTQQDNESPRLVRAWFERSLVTAQTPSQTLFLEVEDASPIRLSEGTYVFGDTTCVKAKNNLKPVGENIYSLEVDVKDCYRPSYLCGDGGCLPERGETRNVHLRGASIFDEVGNFSTYDAKESADRIGFMIYR